MIDDSIETPFDEPAEPSLFARPDRSDSSGTISDPADEPTEMLAEDDAEALAALLLGPWTQEKTESVIVSEPIVDETTRESVAASAEPTGSSLFGPVVDVRAEHLSPPTSGRATLGLLFPAHDGETLETVPESEPLFSTEDDEGTRAVGFVPAAEVDTEPGRRGVAILGLVLAALLVTGTLIALISGGGSDRVATVDREPEVEGVIQTRESSSTTEASSTTATTRRSTSTAAPTSATTAAPVTAAPAPAAPQRPVTTRRPATTRPPATTAAPATTATTVATTAEPAVTFAAPTWTATTAAPTTAAPTTAAPTSAAPATPAPTTAAPTTAAPASDAAASEG